ncbi:MAG TPA: MATE family efflux transporter [Polyangiaceae bacterium]|nr:MATE family efflux transporter [Polyangiaceae bacterium]
MASAPPSTAAPAAASPALSTAGTTRALLHLAWPIVLQRASQAVIGFSDALMVAPLGESALAAVTTGSLNALLFIILPSGIVFILQSFTSQLRGRGDLGAVRRYAWYGLALAALAGLISLAALPLLSGVLRRFDYTPEVREDLAAYLAIRLLSVGPAVGIEALGNWFGGLGKTRPSMVAGITAMGANVVGNYLLIEPHLGLPGHGVRGAAWASTLATVAGFLFILVPFAREAKSAQPGSWSTREFGRVLRFGVPNGINWFLEFAAFVLFINVMVTPLGTTTLAAFNVALQLNSVAFMPAFGLASAGAILVGEAIGRRAQGEVWRYVRLTLATAALWMVSVGVLYFLWPVPLLELFAQPGENRAEFLQLGALMLAFSAFWQLFDAAGITFSEALRAAGDTTWCMWLRIVLAWILFLPGSWYFVVARQGGVPAVMSMLVAYILLLASAFALRFWSGKWRSIELIDTPQPGV